MKKTMYKPSRPTPSTIVVNDGTEGETIEQKMNRIVNNKEPIKDGAPITYTERKDGVKPEHNIRTDRFEIALEATDNIAKSHLAKRKQTMDEFNKKNKDDKTPDTGEDKTAEPSL
jgi:histidinol dehydrogenase